MRVALDLARSAIENAQHYYEKAKKAREKIKGAEEAIARTRAKLEEARAEEAPEERPSTLKVRRQREWFERFRWFLASDGRLVIGGRDATTNEILVKKHMQPQDVVFHADLPGSPFMLVRVEGEGEPPAEVLAEAAEATASYSKAWGLGYTSLDVFWVRGSQVSASPPSGEYLPRGSFMIYGAKSYVRNAPLRLAIGATADGRLMGGPASAVARNCAHHVVIVPGQRRSSQLAREVLASLRAQATEEEREGMSGLGLDDVQGLVPAGLGELERRPGASADEGRTRAGRARGRVASGPGRPS